MVTVKILGIGATIFDSTKVGRKCIVGDYSVVKRNLPDFSKITIPIEGMVIKQYTEDEVASKLIYNQNVR